MSSERADGLISIEGLGHVVYFAEDPIRMSEFYEEMLNFEIIEELGDALFLRSSGAEGHFNLGIFKSKAGREEVPASLRGGTYHVAWMVPHLDDFLLAYRRLLALNAIVGTSDHGTHLSVYARDPENNEFDVCWETPRDEWVSRGFGFSPLDVEAECARREAYSSTSEVDGNDG